MANLYAGASVTPAARAATFSPCGRYRYDLWRRWEMFNAAPGYVLFIGLNPSTATATLDDPTIRRCIGFCRTWGHAALCMSNLFAWRDTDPRAMKLAADPVGPENDDRLLRLATAAALIVCAWARTAPTGTEARPSRGRSRICPFCSLAVGTRTAPPSTPFIWLRQPGFSRSPDESFRRPPRPWRWHAPRPCRRGPALLD